MQGRFTSYLTNVPMGRASVWVNLDFREQVVGRELPVELRVRIDLTRPGENGFLREPERSVISRIVDQIASALGVACNAVFAGRVNVVGKVFLYFYGDHPEVFGQAVGAVMRDFPVHGWKADSRPNRSFQAYEETLWPNAFDWFNIGNRRVVAQLRSRGDDGSAPRPITHVACFPSFGQAAAFLNDARGLGFTGDLGAHPNGASDAVRLKPGEFSVWLEREDRVDGQFLVTTLGKLWHLAQQNGGSHEAWESLLVTADGPVREEGE